MKPLATYRLVVEVQPDRRLPGAEADAPPIVTLRRGVKTLWRAFRLRVVRVEESQGQGWTKPDSSVPFDGHGAGV